LTSRSRSANNSRFRNRKISGTLLAPWGAYGKAQRLAGNTPESKSPMTEIRTAEQPAALSSRSCVARNAERITRVLESLPVGVVVLDGEGVVREANSSARRLLADPLLNESWRVVIARAFASDEAHNGARLRDGRPVRVATCPLVELKQCAGTENGELAGQVVLIEATEAPPRRDCVDRGEARLPQDLTGDEELIANDVRMREVVQLAARVAATDATVLLTGESGTGKEVVARFIHRRSRRARGPFVAINCAAIPETMLEATLFGYEKGAFTGAAAATPGKFEQAQGGTLLLDEISEMPLQLQAKLLRVLQEREVERLGSRRTIALDVRVLATTNRGLRDEVAAGRFREDLYYRLNVFPLALPPLRARGADIVPLTQALLARHARALGRALPAVSPAAAERLAAYAWPGNVRELDNLVQRALILHGGDTIEADDLRFEAAGAPSLTGYARSAFGSPPSPACGKGNEGEGARVGRGEAPLPHDLGDDLRLREQNLILEALHETAGSRQAAAARLGISPRTLRYKLARMREAGIAIP
jgi:two-component system response regulator FlrC